VLVKDSNQSRDKHRAARRSSPQNPQNVLGRVTEPNRGAECCARYPDSATVPIAELRKFSENSISDESRTAGFTPGLRLIGYHNA
jgi:hypothetical protein